MVTDRATRCLLAISSVCLGCASVVRIAVALAAWAQLDHVSGVWIAMATDLADGLFYRPLFSDGGYGGTRYFPLHFVLHGSLIRLGSDPIIAGHAIALLSMGALMAAVYVLLRRLQVPSVLAGPAAVLTLASYTAQYAVTTIRGDLVPAALNVWGLACCACSGGDGGSRPRVLAAAVFFTLAFAAKFTTVFGFVAGVLALGLSGQRAAARKLGAATLAGMALVLILIGVVSRGRAFESLLLCSSGGATLADVSRGPYYFFASAIKDGPVTAGLWLLGTVSLISLWRSTWRELPSLAVLAAAVVTFALYASPGIDFNHLLDLNVAMVIVVVVQVARGRVPAWFGATALSVIALLAAIFVVMIWRGVDERRNWRKYACAVRAVAGARPILAEDTLVPVLAGERPYVLDPFMLGVIGKHRPEVAADLAVKMEEGFFGSVVLQTDPGSAGGKRFLEQRCFGEAFVDRLQERYQLVARCGNLLIYHRRPESASTAP